MNIIVYLSSSTGNNSNKKSLALPYVKSGIYIICSQICFYIKKDGSLYNEIAHLKNQIKNSPL